MSLPPRTLPSGELEWTVQVVSRPVRWIAGAISAGIIALGGLFAWLDPDPSSRINQLALVFAGVVALVTVVALGEWKEVWRFSPGQASRLSGQTMRATFAVTEVQLDEPDRVTMSNDPLERLVSIVTIVLVGPDRKVRFDSRMGRSAATDVGRTLAEALKVKLVEDPRRR